ncbi:MAG: hypothetical protein R3213_01825 [Flavobacteriaceae bacterium]|nr:hypothetical protein [Flavobacteriaceae bacterium]
MFDHLFFSAFEALKPRYKKSANNLAILYISILQILIFVIIGVFFKAFVENLNVVRLSADKIWAFLILGTVIIFFKNWIQYSGKKRKVLNSKITRTQEKKFSILGLLLFPLGCLLLLIILTQAV